MTLRLRARFILILTLLLTAFAAAIVSVYWLSTRESFRDMEKASRDIASEALTKEEIRQNEAMVQLIAEQLVNPLYFNEFEVVNNFATTALEQKGIIYIYIFDPSGRIIHDGTETLEAFGDVLDDPQLHEALNEQRLVSATRGPILHTTVPVMSGTKILGGVRIGVSLTAIQNTSAQIEDELTKITDSEASNLVQSILLLTMGLVVAGVLAGVLLFKGVTRTIITLTGSMKDIGRGRYDVDFSNGSTRRNDELGELARSVKNMAQSLAVSENRLREALNTAQSANEAKSKFLSSVSHELRTPLNAILGFGQLLYLKKDALDDNQVEAVGQILRGGEHLLELIDDVLNLACIEVGEIKLDIVPTNAAPIVRQCIKMTEPLAAKCDVMLTWSEMAGDMPAVDVDGTRFKQVLLNLLSNAVKYNRAGGSVSLAIELSEDGMVRFSVTDTGGGIPKDMQDRLFNPFDRMGHESGTIEGTGIGLSITKELTERMQGRIGFESEVGSGSAFWVEFPIAGKLPAKAPAVKAKPAGHGVDAETSLPTGPRPVLYIEDDPSNIELMESVMRSLGNVDLRVASNAEIGLAMARADHPDLILMDIHLPGMSGTEALRQLKQSGETAHIPVLAISADAIGSNIDAAMAEGFEGYITKPFKMVKLTDTVRKILKESR